MVRKRTYDQWVKLAVYINRRRLGKPPYNIRLEEVIMSPWTQLYDRLFVEWNKQDDSAPPIGI